MSEIYEALTKFLEKKKSDKDIIELFQIVRALQVNKKMMIKDAILEACQIDNNMDIVIDKENKHKDNIPYMLATKYRYQLLKLRRLGYGYLKISKLLAQRSIFNKKTRRAYSPMTIKRALKILGEIK